MVQFDSNTISRRKVIQTATGCVSIPVFSLSAMSKEEGPDKVIEFKELSKRAQNIFRKSLKQKERKEYKETEFPSSLVENTYISYRGSLYKLNNDYYMKPIYYIRTNNDASIDDNREHIQTVKMNDLG